VRRVSFEDLNSFAVKNNILLRNKKESKSSILEEFVQNFHRDYYIKKEVQEKHQTFLDFMGETLLKDDNIKEHLIEFDFISKQELIEVFADYCADLEISVFDASKIEEYSLDLYLTRKTPLLRTEAVVVRTGFELSPEEYEYCLTLLNNAGQIASWTVFVTTPLGTYKIGLKRLIEDMEKLKTWLYIVDPIHKTIKGITRGKKSKSYDNSMRDKYIEKLPHQPIRAPAQVKKISKYKFSEGDSYNPEDFIMYDIVTEEIVSGVPQISKEESKYATIFRNFILIDIKSGLPIFSFSSKEHSLDEILISGFLNAMDGFISELGGSSSMTDINYKGFYVLASYGKLIKIALFLSEPADQILFERMEYFIKHFERRYEEKLNQFSKDGDISFFLDNENILTMVKWVLDI